MIEGLEEEDRREFSYKINCIVETLDEIKAEV